MKLHSSPVQSIEFRQRKIYIKRDDLLHADFSGNKARKLAALLDNDWPAGTTLLGCGSAQANSLHSLASLAQLKGWHLRFYVDHIAPWLKQHPCGNYLSALNKQVELVEVGEDRRQRELNLQQYMEQVVAPQQPSAKYIPEGGRSPLAKQGLYQLAEELVQWHRQALADKPLLLMLPSGTGTTALYLSEYFKLNYSLIEVYSCACVGDEDYLVSQFSELQKDSALHPTLLARPKKWHFAQPYAEHLMICRELKQQTGLSFELLYDPVGWHSLLAYIEESDEQRELMYLHQGGLLGNQSMLGRYRRKFPALFTKGSAPI